MKRLLDLQLSIPTIDELTSRKLMGGDGYVPENDLSNALPEFDNDDMIEINIEDDVIITGDYPGVPNAPETEYDIPDPNMEPIEQERPDSNEEPEFDDDRDDFQNNDQDNPNEYEGPDGNHQGNTNNQGNDSEHEQLTPIDILISKLSEKQQDFLKSYNPTIIIDTDMQEEGQYIKEENLIRLKNTDNAKALFSELVHAYQNSKGMLNDTSRSNNEFQEHVLADIFSYYDFGMMSAINVLEKDATNYSLWLEDITHGGDRSQPINMELFHEKVNYFFESFREHYKYSGKGDEVHHPGYSKDPNPNYDWQWEEYIDFMLPDNSFGNEKPSNEIMSGD